MRIRPDVALVLAACLLEPLAGPRVESGGRVIQIDPDFIAVTRADGTSCRIPESIVSKVFSDPERTVLLVDAYSGSEQWSRVYRAQDCKPLSPKILYAEYEAADQTLRRRPFCYEGKCFRGRIYQMNEQCVPVYDPIASKAFTRDVLGDKADTTKFKD